MSQNCVEDDPPQLAPARSQECRAAEVALGITAASDLAFLLTLGGSGVAALGARGVRLTALRIGNVYGYSQAAIEIHARYRAKRLAVAGMAAFAVRGEIASSPAVAVTSADLTGSLSVWDFVPGVGSYRAYKTAERACGW